MEIQEALTAIEQAIENRGQAKASYFEAIAIRPITTGFVVKLVALGGAEAHGATLELALIASAESLPEASEIADERERRAAEARSNSGSLLKW